MPPVVVGGIDDDYFESRITDFERFTSGATTIRWA
jgi:hypothetical protein